MIRPETLAVFSSDDYQAPTADEIRHAFEACGLSNRAAGQLLGVNPRTIRKWTYGERTMPYAAWRLLTLAMSER